MPVRVEIVLWVLGVPLTAAVFVLLAMITTEFWKDSGLGAYFMGRKEDKKFDAQKEIRALECRVLTNERLVKELRCSHKFDIEENYRHGIVFAECSNCGKSLAFKYCGTRAVYDKELNESLERDYDKVMRDYYERKKKDAENQIRALDNES